MLRAFKVEKLVISALPSLVETWTGGFGFEPMEDDERMNLSHINLMVFPKSVVEEAHFKQQLNKVVLATFECKFLFGNTGSGHASPLITDNPTKNRCLLQRRAHYRPF